MDKNTIKIQGTYQMKTGTFLVNETEMAQSPIFNNYYELSQWLHEHFIFRMGERLNIEILKMIKKPNVSDFGKKLK